MAGMASSGLSAMRHGQDGGGAGSRMRHSRATGRRPVTGGEGKRHQVNQLEGKATDNDLCMDPSTSDKSEGGGVSGADDDDDVDGDDGDDGGDPVVGAMEGKACAGEGKSQQQQQQQSSGSGES